MARRSSISHSPADFVFDPQLVPLPGSRLRCFLWWAALPTFPGSRSRVVSALHRISLPKMTPGVAGSPTALSQPEPGSDWSFRWELWSRRGCLEEGSSRGVS